MFELRKNILLGFLSKEYPRSKIQFIGSGWSSIVFLVDDYIVRFPKQNTLDYQFEASICDKLRDKVFVELPVVNIVEAEHPYAIHKQIVGNLWSNSSEVIDYKLCEDCAVFLAQVHSVMPIDDIREAPSSGFIKLGVLEQKLSNCFSGTVLNSLCKKYETISNGTEDDIVFIHADFNGCNSVVGENGRLKGVFDWCNSGIGERAKDFIHLYNCLNKKCLEIIFYEYWKNSGIHVDINHVKELALINLVNKLYWSDVKSQYGLELCKKIERLLK